MKKLIFAAIALILILIAGCAAVPKRPSCPPEDTLFMTPIGPLQMPKGFFDKGEGENWMHTNDYNTMQKKQQGF